MVVTVNTYCLEFYQNYKAISLYLFVEGKKSNIMELLFVLHKKYEVEKLVAYKNLNSRIFTKT